MVYKDRDKEKGQGKGKGGNGSLEGRNPKIWRGAVIAVGFGDKHKEISQLMHPLRGTDNVVHTTSSREVSLKKQDLD